VDARWQRRVVVKARVVKLAPQRGQSRGSKFRATTGKAVDAHLRYLERDGVTKDGEKGRVYSAFENEADGKAFVERGRDDRHQFRFIVAPEDGADMADMRSFTRDLMKQVEQDLDTRLDWVAVDHHNTGHPHTHVIVRGVLDDGRILNIAGDYIAHGVRGFVPGGTKGKCQSAWNIDPLSGAIVASGGLIAIAVAILMSIWRARATKDVILRSPPLAPRAANPTASSLSART
jgi:hypothetical protein